MTDSGVCAAKPSRDDPPAMSSTTWGARSCPHQRVQKSSSSFTFSRGGFMLRRLHGSIKRLSIKLTPPWTSYFGGLAPARASRHLCPREITWRGIRAIRAGSHPLTRSASKPNQTKPRTLAKENGTSRVDHAQVPRCRRRYLK